MKKYIYSTNLFTDYKFSAKNTSLFAWSGFICALCELSVTCPALLNSLSDGELLAEMAKYFQAT